MDKLDSAWKSTILLVEDNDNDILLLERAFREARVLNPGAVVSNGKQAIEYLTRVHAHADPSHHPIPGLVLLDLTEAAGLLLSPGRQLKLPRFRGVLASSVDYASVGWTSIACS